MPSFEWFEIEEAKVYGQTLRLFFVDWMMKKTVRECIANASNPKLRAIPIPVKGNEKYKVAEMPFTRKTSQIFVVGHSGLKVDGWDETLDGGFFVQGLSD